MSRARMDAAVGLVVGDEARHGFRVGLPNGQKGHGHKEEGELSTSIVCSLLSVYVPIAMTANSLADEGVLASKCWGGESGGM